MDSYNTIILFCFSVYLMIHSQLHILYSLEWRKKSWTIIKYYLGIHLKRLSPPPHPTPQKQTLYSTVILGIMSNSNFCHACFITIMSLDVCQVSIFFLWISISKEYPFFTGVCSFGYYRLLLVSVFSYQGCMSKQWYQNKMKTSYACVCVCVCVCGEGRERCVGPSDKAKMLF
jgi:hypothetical protein